MEWLLAFFSNTGKTGGRYETDTHRSALKVQKKWWISVTFVSHRPMLHLRAPSFAGITFFNDITKGFILTVALLLACASRIFLLLPGARCFKHDPCPPVRTEMVDCKHQICSHSPRKNIIFWKRAARDQHRSKLLTSRKDILEDLLDVRERVSFRIKLGIR
jgi:hypothetical protein